MFKIHYKKFQFLVLNLIVVLGMVMLLFPISALSEGHDFPNVVSLDYCADQYVLLLSDRKQIIAVSKAAEDVYSFYRDRAKGLSKTDSSIEEVIMLKPDLAIQTYQAAAHMDEMTARSDILLIQTQYGSDPETVQKNIQTVGKAIGQTERAEEFVKSYKNRLRVLQVEPSKKLRIAYITPSGITAGKGTSVDDIINMSGFENYLEKYKLNGWTSIPLELLISDPPDIFMTSFFERDAVTQSRWSLSRHDFLFKMMEEIPTITIPSTMMSCGGLFHVNAAELIRMRAMEIE